MHRIWLHRAIASLLTLCVCVPMFALAQQPVGSSYGPPTSPAPYPTTGPYANTPPAGYPNTGGFANPSPNPNTGPVQPGLNPAGRPVRNFTGQEFEGAMRLATVGNEIIFASDVMPRVDEMLKQYKGKVPDEQLRKQRWVLAKQAVDGMLDVKRVMQDFQRTMPADRLPMIREQVDESFQESRVPQLMDALKVNSRGDLEAKLRERGSSLALESDKYFERSLAQQWLRQQAKAKEKFSHEELMEYYQNHQKDFEKKGKVRWQELSVRFSKHASKAEAWAKLADMGNAVLQGVPFEQVARQASDGFSAREGGMRDWTNQGSLASDKLDQALFSLPVGQPSPIIEGPTAFHIVRALERVDQHVTPFRDAQIEITEKLKEESEKAALQDYQAKLKREIRVWTAFDDPEFVRRIGMPPLPPRR